MKTEIVYVYGTLRPGTGEKILVPGTLYDMGWFPAIVINPYLASVVVCEKIEVKHLDHVDAYEGYHPDYVKESLYIRRKYLDGWIYEINPHKDFNKNRVVASGDWLEYTQKERGENANRFT